MAMDLIQYGSGAYYIFDREYIDYEHPYRITGLGSFFVIRAKKTCNVIAPNIKMLMQALAL